MPPRAKRPTVLTVDEVRRELRIGKRQCYELIRSGVLSHVRLGRSIRVTREQLDRFLGGGGGDGRAA